MTYTIITPKPTARTVHVYCGNYTGRGPYPTCETNTTAILPPNPKDDDLAVYTCPGCQALNIVKLHRTDRTVYDPNSIPF